MVLAGAAMPEHEPDGAHHAARKRKPEVVVEPAAGEDRARGGVEDDAGVVLGQRRQRTGERTLRRCSAVSCASSSYNGASRSLPRNIRWVMKYACTDVNCMVIDRGCTDITAPASGDVWLVRMVGAQ